MGALNCNASRSLLTGYSLRIAGEISSFQIVVVVVATPEMEQTWQNMQNRVCELDAPPISQTMPVQCENVDSCMSSKPHKYINKAKEDLSVEDTSYDMKSCLHGAIFPEKSKVLRIAWNST